MERRRPFRYGGCARAVVRAPCPESTMHEFQVLATFAVIAAIYIGLFLAAEKFFMKDK